MPHASPAPTTSVGPDRAQIETCVHCGFCLPSCPTYMLWGEEMDSPRGRIYLARAKLDGRIPIDQTYVRHFDACLGCVACVTACPSGVQYGPILEDTRAQIEREYVRPWGDRAFRRLLFAVMPFPQRLRIALLPLLAYQLVEPVVRRAGILRALPTRLRTLLAVAPPVSWASLWASVPAHTAAHGPRRLTVGLLTGCVQRLVFGSVHRATVNVLSAEGCDVVTPPGQGCCGALALHTGRQDEARQFARRLIARFEEAGVEQVVVNAAGCGSAMKEYGHLLKDDAEWAERAARFSAKVRDVHEVVDALSPARAVRHPLPIRVAYQDACHLAHAQGVRQQPRDLLRSIPGLTLVDVGEPEVCCGSAGIYNLVQPQAANALGDRKVRHLAAAGADVIASGNPGCTLQIVASAARLGHSWPVRHPIELLDLSIRGQAAPVRTPSP